MELPAIVGTTPPPNGRQEGRRGASEQSRLPVDGGGKGQGDRFDWP